MPARSVGRHELHAAVLRSGAPAVLRDRARNLRDLPAGEAGDRPRPRISTSGTVRRDAEHSYGALRAIDRDDGRAASGSSSIRRRRWRA